MPKLYRVRLVHKKTGDITELKGEFSDDDVRLLSRFREYAADLSQAQLLKNGTGPSVEVSWTQEHGLATHSIPPAADVRELLHLLRPLILESESTYLPKVCGILGRRLDHQFIRKKLGEIGDVFSGRRLGSTYTFAVGDVVLNSDAGLRLWLNAYEYHRDDDKRLVLEQIGATVPLDVARAFFLDVLMEKVQAIGSLADLVGRLLSSPSPNQSGRSP